MATDLISGLVQGYNQARDTRLSREANDEMKKLQIKLFKSNLEDQEQRKQAKSKLMDFLGGSQGPGMPIQQAMQNPAGQALALQSGMPMQDVVSMSQQKPDLLSMLAQGQLGELGDNLGLKKLSLGPDGQPRADFEPPDPAERIRIFHETGIDIADPFSQQKFNSPGGLSPKQAQELLLDEKKSQIKREKFGTMVDRNLTEMANAYKGLVDLGAMVDVDKSTISNIMAKARSSGPGQFIEGATGTKAQSLRTQINQLKPALINNIREATGMSAKAMDTDRELQFYLNTIGGEDRDIQSSLAALDLISENYGLGTKFGSSKEAKDKLKEEAITTGAKLPQGIPQGSIIIGNEEGTNAPVYQTPEGKQLVIR